MAGGFGWRRPVGPGQSGDGLGLFSGQQIERLVIAALREVTLDEAMDRAGNLTEQPGDVVVPWRWQRMKLHGTVGTGGEHTRQRQYPLPLPLADRASLQGVEVVRQPPQVRHRQRAHRGGPDLGELLRGIDELVSALLASVSIAAVFRDGLACLLANARRSNLKRNRKTGRLRRAWLSSDRS